MERAWIVMVIVLRQLDEWHQTGRGPRSRVKRVTLYEVLCASSCCRPDCRAAQTGSRQILAGGKRSRKPNIRSVSNSGVYEENDTYLAHTPDPIPDTTATIHYYHDCAATLAASKCSAATRFKVNKRLQAVVTAKMKKKTTSSAPDLLVVRWVMR